jgi:hypothetical protein
MDIFAGFLLGYTKNEIRGYNNRSFINTFITKNEWQKIKNINLNDGENKSNKYWIELTREKIKNLDPEEAKRVDHRFDQRYNEVTKSIKCIKKTHEFKTFKRIMMNYVQNVIPSGFHGDSFPE